MTLPERKPVSFTVCGGRNRKAYTEEMAFEDLGLRFLDAETMREH